MLNEEIKNIENLLKDVLNDLSLIETADFQVNFDNAKNKMQLFNKMKEKLIKDYPIEELSNRSHGLIFLTKQINNKYDNIIEVKKKQMQEIVLRMKLLQNRKKLINYSR